MTGRAIQLPIAVACFLTMSLSFGADSNDPLELKRDAFRAVRADVERGNWQTVLPNESLLQDYVLWPDLRALYLKANIATADRTEVNSFLDQYGTLKPARELRYRLALQLVKEGQLSRFLEIYQQFYQGLEIASLDCLALQAEIEADQIQRVVNRAIDLWNVGKSQAEECDVVFDQLRDQNLLTRNHYESRFALAIEAKQFSLARYLARTLEPNFVQIAEEWQRAQNKPTTLIAEYLDYADTDLTHQLFAYAIERLAYDDPLVANKHWRKLTGHFSFSDSAADKNRRHIALWAARMRLPEATDLLIQLPDTARDVETGRWIIRSHLLHRRWPDVIDEIRALPSDEKQKGEWQYWEAVALEQLNDNEEAATIFERLAAEREFYGFLAADRLNAPYALTDEPLPRNDSVFTQLTNIPGVIRARELYYVGLEAKGRSEWDAEMRALSADEKIQAALLADSWGWHSKAIATVAKAGAYDDLRMRYPLPWREDFEGQSNVAGISSSWAYGVARSESLFMRDIRSSAGAIGLMQLMPATGQETAKEVQLPWSGIATLTNSESNIQLGTHYLGKMFRRFGNNRILATAAYNAGPARIEKWLPSSGSLDARIWIENIPYNETRAYVRRVLFDETIFHWRLTGQIKRLSPTLQTISAAQLAARNGQSD